MAVALDRGRPFRIDRLLEYLAAVATALAAAVIVEVAVKPKGQLVVLVAAEHPAVAGSVEVAGLGRLDTFYVSFKHKQ